MSMKFIELNSYEVMNYEDILSRDINLAQGEFQHKVILPVEKINNIRLYPNENFISIYLNNDGTNYYRYCENVQQPNLGDYNDKVIFEVFEDEYKANERFEQLLDILK